jgi:hypothetical protein
VKSAHVAYLGNLNTCVGASRFCFIAPDAKWFFTDEEIASAFVSNAAFDLAA